jgi:hypothetical protein
MNGASFHRHASNQCVATPREFIVAFTAKWGAIGIDLAALEENAVCERFISPQQNTWETDWLQYADGERWAWLNPEHESSGRAAQRMYAFRAWSYDFMGALLVPAAVGSKWWREHVDGKCLEVLPFPRISFDDAHSYPKDLALCLYGKHEAGRVYWDWHHDVHPQMLIEMKRRHSENRKRLFELNHPYKVAAAAAKRAERERKRLAKLDEKIIRRARHINQETAQCNS